MADMIAPWFEDYRDVFDGTPDFRRFIELESGAHAVLTWQPGVIPGLLQTHAYASTIMAIYLPGISKTEIDRCVELRMARKRHLETHHLDFIIGESALTDDRFSAEVMSEQRAALASTLSRGRPNVTIRIAPARVGNPEKSFVILRFPNRSDVLYLERGTQSIFKEDASAVEEALTAFQELVSVAFNLDNNG
jgi:hypothetical protein